MGEGVLLYGMNPMRHRQEVVQRFVDGVLSDGKPRKRAMQVSTIPTDVYSRLRDLGYPVKSDHIFLPDNTILKYRDHPKGAKGATLPFKQFWKIVNIARKPKSIYIDSHSKRLVFVFASRHIKGKVIKFILEPNYKIKGKTVNAITSIGVVDKSKMKSLQYLKLK